MKIDLKTRGRLPWLPDDLYEYLCEVREESAGKRYPSVQEVIRQIIREHMDARMPGELLDYLKKLQWSESHKRNRKVRYSHIVHKVVREHACLTQTPIH